MHTLFDFSAQLAPTHRIPPTTQPAPAQPPTPATQPGTELSSYAAHIARIDGHLIGTGDEGHHRTPERTAVIQSDLLSLARLLNPGHNSVSKGYKTPPTSKTVSSLSLYHEFNLTRSPIYLIERGRIADARVAIHTGSTCPHCRAQGTVSVNISHTGRCVVNADNTVTVRATPGFLGGWACARCQAGDSGVPLTVHITRGAAPTAPRMTP